MPERTIIKNKRFHVQDAGAYLNEHSSSLQPLMNEMRNLIEVCAIKVAAHITDPAAYPLPSSDSKSLENILYQRLMTLPLRNKEIAAVNVPARLKRIEILQNSKYQNIYQSGTIQKINTAVPIFDAAEVLLKETAARTGNYLNELFISRQQQIHTLSSNPDSMKAVLRIHKIKCLDETDPEGGDDEISLAAAITQPDGKTTKISPELIRDDFEKDIEKIYTTPWEYARYFVWDRYDTNAFPRHCSCMFILSELDNGGFPGMVQDIYDYLKEKIIKAVAAYIEAQAGGVIGGPIGAIVGAVLGYAMDELFSVIKDIWEDDVFPPKIVDINFKDKFSNFDGYFTSNIFTCFIEGLGGKYSIDFSWQMQGQLSDPNAGNLANGWEPEPQDIEGVIIYKNASYDGDYKLLASGSYSLTADSSGMRLRRASPFNDEIDSVKVGKGYFATLFKTGDFTGESLEIYHDNSVPYFDDNWRDQISSIVVGKLTERIG